MGFSGAAHGIEDGRAGGGGGGGGAKRPTLFKICHTCPTMMKLGTVIPYQKRSTKYMNHVTLPLDFADITNFSPEISKSRNQETKKYMHRLHFDTKFLILLTFL